ncbi:MAG: AtzE family amidohydrolase [Rhodospirillales bacterium]|nr:AtzE family amidohydrolase [Rhodospirillales bacterium]
MSTPSPTAAFATAETIADAVRRRQVTAVEIARATLQRIAEGNKRLNAFTQVTEQRALAEAAAIDAKVAAGRDPGPLAGVPFAAKNLFDISGLATVAGSKINRDLKPATADASAVQRLNAHGAVLMGALNMGEYAYDFTGENVHDGPSRNPHDLGRMSGGSSGGSGSAVGGGLVPIALATDTNGSIRVPASLCGIFGIKPTYGRLGRHGSFPFVASLDHIGPLARSVADLAMAYDALQGHDPGDPASTDRPREPSLPGLKSGIAGLRIAVAGDYFQRGATPDALAAVELVAKALRAKATVTLPEAARARAAAFLITASEGANLHLERLRTRAADFDPATRDRLLAGALAPAQWYLQAQRFRRWYREQVLALFREVDIILAPATPCSAPALGQQTMVLDGVEMPVRPNLGIFTQPISFIGLPVVAVPAAIPSRMPIGVQIIAAPWQEAVALRVAHVLEQAGVARCPIP